MNKSSKILLSKEQLERENTRGKGGGNDPHPKQFPWPESDGSVGNNRGSLEAGDRRIHQPAPAHRPAQSAGHSGDDLLRCFSQLGIALNVPGNK